MSRRAPAGALLVVMLAPLCWAGNFVLARHLESQISAIQLNFWRWFLACLILTPFIARGARELLGELRRHLPILVAQAAAGVAVYHCLVYFALKSTTAINATLINSLVPMFIPLFAFAAFRQRLAFKHLLAIVLSTLGVALVVTRGQLLRISQFEAASGDFLMVLAAMTWAVYTLLLSRKPASIGGVRFLWCLSFVGTLLLLPALCLDLALHGPFQGTVANWISIGYVAVFAAVIAFLAWNYGATKFAPAHLGMFAHLIPVFGSLLAIAFLGESFRWFHALGMALIATGLAIVFANAAAPVKPPSTLRAP